MNKIDFSNMQNRKIIFYFIIILLLSFGCNGHKNTEDTSKYDRPRVVVSALVDKSTATIGDQITFSITVKYFKGIEVDVGSIEKIEDLPVIDMGSAGPKDIEGRVESVKWVKMRADRVGSFIIPPVIVKYKDKSSEGEKEITTTKIFVEVKSVLPEEGTAEDIKDLKPLREIKRDWKWIIISVIGAIFAAVTAFILYRRFKSNKRKVEIPKPIIPPHEAALRELMELKGKGLFEKGEYKSYYFELSEIFRRYLAKRYDFPADDWTIEEILRYMKDKSRCDYAVFMEISSFLKNTDMVKFAKHIPTLAEAEGEFNKAVIIIEKTKRNTDNADNTDFTDKAKDK